MLLSYDEERIHVHFIIFTFQIQSGQVVLKCDSFFEKVSTFCTERKYTSFACEIHYFEDFVLSLFVLSNGKSLHTLPSSPRKLPPPTNVPVPPPPPFRLHA